MSITTRSADFNLLPNYFDFTHHNIPLIAGEYVQQHYFFWITKKLRSTYIKRSFLTSVCETVV